MNETLFRTFVALWMALAVVTFVVLLFMPAPYGRYIRAAKGWWRPRVSGAVGWVMMELPSPVTFALFCLLGPRPLSPAAVVLFLLWEAHYLNRSLIYPLRPLRRQGGLKEMPVLVATLAFFFNIVNGSLNGHYLGALSAYPAGWLSDPRFLCGVALFFIGMGVNVHADEVLLRLRRPGETGYKMPRGGLYEWISCPNYLGEIVEWSGWALASWSLTGASFALWTAANLVPRALLHHAFYQRNFPDYPKGRKAVFPFLL